MFFSWDVFVEINLNFISSSTADSPSSPNFFLALSSLYSVILCICLPLQTMEMS